MLIIFVHNITTLHYCNTTSVISKQGTFSPFSSLVILLLVPSSNFINSELDSWKLYPFFILKVILFSILFTYILIGRLSVFSPCFLNCYILRYSLEYLIHNSIHQVIQICHFTLEPILYEFVIFV